ncbi:hypothetical protein [Aurantibacter sp.]|uniref:hypothetical protein n=1 Tax=Aurantibacter sp. TaxID=2807103 RepID=UPI0035C82257
MKLKLSLFLLFISSILNSQNLIDQKDLEQCIKEYSKAITTENIDLELSLMHPALFLNTKKDTIVNQYFRDESKKDSTLIKYKNKLFIIQEISKPIKRGDLDFKVIDFILVKELTYSKKLLSIMDTVDISYTISRHKKFNSNKSKLKYPRMWISYNKETGVGLSYRNKKILVVKNRISNKWYFISNRWWDFNKSTDKRYIIAWKIKRNYTKKHYSTLPFIIPKKLLKQLKQSNNY